MDQGTAARDARRPVVVANTPVRCSHWRAPPRAVVVALGRGAPSRPTSATPALVSHPQWPRSFPQTRCAARGATWCVPKPQKHARCARGWASGTLDSAPSFSPRARPAALGRPSQARHQTMAARSSRSSFFAALHMADAPRCACSNARHTSSPSSSTACSSVPPVRCAADARRRRTLTALRAPQAPSLSSPCRRSGAHTAGSRPSASPPHTHVSACQQGGASRLRRRQTGRSALLAVLLPRHSGRRTIADVPSGSRAVRLTASLLLQCRSGSARRSASSTMRSRQTRCEGSWAARSRAAGR